MNTLSSDSKDSNILYCDYEKENKKKTDKHQSELEEKNETHHQFAIVKQEGKFQRVFNFFTKSIRKLDSFGDNLDDPGFRKQTIFGALLSVIFKLIFLVLTGVAITKFIVSESELSTGNTIILNPRTESQTSADYPHLKFLVENKLVFFEKERPNIQRITVQDESGLVSSKSFTSINPKEQMTDPKSISVYKKVSIPINTWNDDFSLLKNANSALSSFDLMKLYEEQLTHSFLGESLKAIRIIKAGSASYPEFFNHSISAFVRFQKEQLSSIKSCQLQLNLVNKGEVDLISSKTDILGLRNVSNHFRLSSLLSEEKTWKKENFDQNGKLDNSINSINTFIINAEYSNDDFERFKVLNTDILTNEELKINQNFNNWILLISYVNNFKGISEESNQCADKPEYWDMNRGYANSIDVDDTLLIFPGSSFQNGDWCSNQETPFFVSLMGLQGQEIVKVQNIIGSCSLGMQWIIERLSESPLNFTSQKPTTFSDTPPNEWSCSPDLYNDGINCDCNCGSAMDPTCYKTGFSSDSCLESEICSPFGVCVDEDTEWKTQNGKFVIVSDRCDLYLPKGTIYNIGNIQSDTSDCEICPFESEYNYLPQIDSTDLKYHCNLKTKGKLDPFLQDGSKVLIDSEFINLNMTIFKGAGFPEIEYSSDLDTKKVSVLLDGDQVYLDECKTIYSNDDSSSNIQSLKISADYGIDFLLKKVAVGSVLSSISTKSKSVLIYIQKETFDELLDNENQGEVYFSFPENNFPYYITSSAGIKLKVSGSSLFYVPIFQNKIQWLTLDDYPTFDYGFRLLLKTNIFAGDSSFNVSYDSITDTLGEIQSFPFKLIIEDSNVRKIEVVEVINVKKHNNWNIEKCGVENFNARDGICHCECGEYDPDCASPSPFQFAENEGTVINCNSTHPYCSYPFGTCTNIKPSSTSSIESSSLIFEYILSSPLLFDHSDESIIHYSEFFDSPIWIRRILDIELYKSNQKKQFLPSFRYFSQSNELFSSPSQLDIEISMFLTPKITKFQEISFCPSFEINNTTPIKSTFVNWKLKDSKHLSINCFELKEIEEEEVEVETEDGGRENECVSIENVENSELGNTCVLENKHLHEFSFNISVPLTHRFEESNNINGETEKEDYVYESESKFIFSEEFHFHYDQSIEYNEILFSKQKMSGGDKSNLENDLNRRFFGSIYYRGLGNSNNSYFNSSVPANIPYLFTKFQLIHEDNAFNDLKRFESWPKLTDSSKYLELSNFFTNSFIKFSFDDESSKTEENEDQKLGLLPGYIYTLSAKLQITPIYVANEPFNWIADVFPISLISDTILSSSMLNSYRISVVSQSVKKEELTSEDKFITKVKYEIDIDGKITQYVGKRVYSLSDMLSDIGSSLALTGIGLFLLKAWQTIFQRNVSFVDIQKKNIKLKKKKKEAKNNNKLKNLQNTVKRIVLKNHLQKKEGKKELELQSKQDVKVGTLIDFTTKTK